MWPIENPMLLKITEPQQQTLSHQHRICHGRPRRRQSPGNMVFFKQPAEKKPEKNASFFSAASPTRQCFIQFVIIVEDNKVPN
jgi:hypothetical protein